MKENLKTLRKLPGDGELFIISAPSGAGKTTLCQKLVNRKSGTSIPRLKHSISYTTRPPRKGEINNIHYSFINKRKFQAMIKKREFAEWAVVHGNLYGTSVKRLMETGKKGFDIILDIDTQGATQIKRRFKNAVYIFILPPSMKTLEKRLRGRKSEVTVEIKKRLKRAKEEIKHYKNYDHIIVNVDINKALRELESIITANRLKTSRLDLKLIKKLKSELKG